MNRSWKRQLHKRSVRCAQRILGNLFTTPGATITILILIILKDVLERIEEDTVRKRTHSRVNECNNPTQATRARRT